MPTMPFGHRKDSDLPSGARLLVAALELAQATRGGQAACRATRSQTRPAGGGDDHAPTAQQTAKQTGCNSRTLASLAPASQRALLAYRLVLYVELC